MKCRPAKKEERSIFKPIGEANQQPRKHTYPYQFALHRSPIFLVQEHMLAQTKGHPSATKNGDGDEPKNHWGTDFPVTILGNLENKAHMTNVEKGPQPPTPCHMWKQKVQACKSTLLFFLSSPPSTARILINSHLRIQ